MVRLLQQAFSVEKVPYFGTLTRVGIFVIDLLCAVLSFAGAGFLLFVFDWEFRLPELLRALAVLLVLRAGSAAYFRTHSLIIRYIGEKDFRNVVFSASAATAVFALLILIWPGFFPILRWKSFLLVDFVLLVTFQGNFRVFIRLLHRSISQSRKPRLNTLIFGAGELGAMVERVLRHNSDHNYHVTAFCDDNILVHGKRLNGVKVYDPGKRFRETLKSLDVKVAIIAIRNLPEERRLQFIADCLAARVRVLKMPSAESWIHGGGLRINHLSELNFEDLLNRPAIQLDQSRVMESLQGKVVLVTGCAGSIGSEIVRQVLRYEPRTVIGIDQAESPLADLALELDEHVASGRFRPVIGNIQDAGRMERMFAIERPQVVFHAAAYKHVPVMESFPEEAVKANVLGTRIVADLASRQGVDKFVMISTDKVVNPSNVMGASKRLAEIYVQALNADAGNTTRFVTTRFGNVLGSNGSVVPIFREKIERREPLTVTHPEVSRYFMTIPEACRLVLEAGAMGQGGEIFVFDMGEPVRILDLARNMIRLAGLEPGIDIDIVFTGLRPGEKLTEELLDKQEDLLPTHHHKILRARVRPQDYAQVIQGIERLVRDASSGMSADVLVARIREMVPEFESSNPHYSEPRPGPSTGSEDESGERASQHARP